MLLLRGPGLERAVVEFLKHELRADHPHPRQADLLAGALSFAETSPELGAWREDLRNTMRRSLDAFRHGGVDPARLEATLDEGLAAMSVYRLVALKGQEESALQDELAVEHRTLLQRFAIAGVLKRAQLHDAFLEKIGEIGLARWSRPELAAGVEDSRRASAQAHHERAAALLADKQYDRAFDRRGSQTAEPRVTRRSAASTTRPASSSSTAGGFSSRRTTRGNTRTVLEQIVRQIQGIGRDAGLTPERIEYVHKRIGEGEILDKTYLPLQFRKAEFLAKLGEYMAARDVVTNVERTVPLGASMAEQWLQLDARITLELAAVREPLERQVSDLIASEQFKEALNAAAIGLKADPNNRRLLYLSAQAAAVMRDQRRARAFVEAYLRADVLDCGDPAAAEKTLFELYRWPDPAHGA